jgi:hypothetical protein
VGIKEPEDIMNLILTRGGVLMMKAIITALILVLVGLPVMAEENETVAECSGVNCFDSLFSVESDTGTALTINMYTSQHDFVLSPETGEITLDGKPIEKLSHEEIRDSLKIIAQEMVRNNDESRYLYRQNYGVSVDIEAYESCSKRLEICSKGLDDAIEGFERINNMLSGKKTKGKKK